MVGIAKHQHTRTIRELDDRGVRNAVVSKMLFPATEFRAAGNPEREVVQAGAVLVEAGAVTRVRTTKADGMRQPGMRHERAHEPGLVDALHDREAEYLGIEAKAPIEIGHREIKMRYTRELEFPGPVPKSERSRSHI